MAIQSGIGASLYVDKYDLSGDATAINSITANTNLFDKTTLRNPAMARMALLRDGSMGVNALFNAAAGGSQKVLEALPGAAKYATILAGAVVGSDTFSLQGLQSDFSNVRGQDGSLVLTTTLQGHNTALEIGELLTHGTGGQQTFASAGAGSKLTYAGTSTAYGITAYLHALSIGSGSATVAIQGSSDDITYTNLTGGAFAAVSAAGAQRIATAQNLSIPKYLKVNVTGTFTDLVAVVTVVRYRGAPHP